MLTKRRLVLAVILASAVAMPVSGAVSPGRYGEIMDLAQDFDITHLGNPRTTIGAPEIDLTDVWFDENATEVGINWQVVDITHRSSSHEIFDFLMTFSCGNLDLTAWVTVNPPGDPGFPEGPQGVIFAQEHGSPRYSNYYFNATIEGNVLHGVYKRADFPCTTVTNELASTALGEPILQNPVTGGDIWGGGWWGDRAPNAGTGPPFTLPSA